MQWNEATGIATFDHAGSKLLDLRGFTVIMSEAFVQAAAVSSARDLGFHALRA